MVSEKICSEILQLVLGNNVTMTRTEFPGTDDEQVSTNVTESAIMESGL